MKSKWPLYYNASEDTERRAKSLRRKSTDAEKLLWKILRDRKIKDLKFRRQHPLNHFIADFYCHEAKLVIELDGDIHEIDEVKNYDEWRQKAIKELGLTVLRFTNEQIFSDPDIVIKKVEEFLHKT